MQEQTQRLLEFIQQHPGKVIGTVFGLVVGWLIISYGLLRALFVVACVIGGFYIGSRIDSIGSVTYGRPSLSGRKRKGWD